MARIGTSALSSRRLAFACAPPILRRFAGACGAGGALGRPGVCGVRAAMEDADVMDASEWEAYDPRKAAVAVDGSATGRVLPHLLYAARGGGGGVRSADGTTRVQVLSDRLVRVERAADRAFEDRASFCFAFRGDAPGADYEVQELGDAGLVVTTACMEVRVDPAGDGVVSARVVGGAGERGARKVFFGSVDGVPGDDGDLGGTCRTLDEADGYFRREWGSGRRRRHVALGNGLLSRDARVTFVDDTARPLFTEEGWFAPREAREGYVDCYALACGGEYAAALTAFAEAAGPVPMVPRRYLGNWWSRYYPYEQEELRELMEKFGQFRVPLSMCIVDMDWHLVKKEDGVAESSDGWTGYTWNKRLFPDHGEFVQWLHDRDTGTALNLHPAGGVHKHEERYLEFAEYIGAVARKTGDPVPFDLTDPMSASAYFKCLIQPLEEEAGELAKWSWWLDWQQGAASRMHGVDPLFLLNHLHYLDMARGSDEGKGIPRRPVVFSRYAGHGSHRTPIGFSGDTYSTWDSLAFQGYMTQTAANSAFPYWSHDIGGHTRGTHDDALYVRWVQFGVLSPIMRLHSSNNPFIFRMPWSFGLDACKAACSALRMRHALVPYTYSCNYDTFKTCNPLVKPMYYADPEDANAYVAPAQYWFGSELVVAPFVSPPCPKTLLSRQAVWLPPSFNGQSPVVWRHLYSGEAYASGWHSVYGKLDDIPIFAPAGAIVPMAHVPSSEKDAASINSVSNPAVLDVHVVAGGLGEFELYEDEEVGEGRAFVTHMSCWYESGVMEVDIAAPRKVESKNPSAARKQDVHNAPLASEADIEGVIPPTRTWRLRIVGVGPHVTAHALSDDDRARPSRPDDSESDSSAPLDGSSAIQVDGVYDAETESMTFVLADRPSTEMISVSFSCDDVEDEFLSARDRTEEKVKDMIDGFMLGSEKKWDLLKMLPQILDDAKCLGSLTVSEEVPDPSGTLYTITPSMKLALFETVEHCGFVRNYSSRPCAPAVFWSGPRTSLTLAVRCPGSSKDRGVVLKDEKVQILYAPGTQESEFSKDPASDALVADGVVADIDGVLSVTMPMQEPSDKDGDPAFSLAPSTL